MKRILFAALAFVSLSGGTALAQYGGSDVGSTPGVPSGNGSDMTNGTDTAPSTGNQSDSDQPVGTNPDGSMNDQNDMPGMGKSGSELPDLGTPERNLGEPDTSSSDTTVTPNSQPPTNDEEGAQLPSSPTNTPDVNR